MILIPIGVDVPFDRRPFVNWLIIILCVVVFGLWIAAAVQAHPNEPEGFNDFVLDGYTFSGLFGHMWLHAGPMHLIGNMFFLWIFGNAVCSKIGNLMYLPAYILLGLIAAVSFNMFSDGQAVGASGAINGIVGMYLVFFPLNDITYFWMVYVRFSGEFSFSSFWAILMWFAFDIYGAVAGKLGVAYTAHIGGFLAGVTLAVVLLKLRIVVMEDDECSLLQALSGKNNKQDEEDRLWEMRHNTSQLHRDLYRAEDEYEQDYEDDNERIAGLQQRFAYQRGENSAEPPALVEPVDDGYIRFSCQCGKRIKVPSKYSGKTGKCPKCTSRVQIPG